MASRPIRESGEYQRRYATEEEAIAGHEAIVAELRAQAAAIAKVINESRQAPRE